MESRSATFAAIGTTAQIVVTDRSALPVARHELEREIAAIDLACSRFREDSELARVNAGNGEWIAVGPVFVEAAAVALRAARLTDGAVDPTVGRALEDAGYDRDFALVGAQTLARARLGGHRPAWRSIELDSERGLVRVPRGVHLDFGATAKALAADRAATRAWSATGTGVLVNLGGDIALAGTPPIGGWLVHVTDDHTSTAAAPGQSIALVSGGLATSSTTVRRWRTGAGDAHHIIDPSTGEAAEEVWRTVSVAAGSCVDANIAATAAIVMGLDAVPWLSGLGLPARLVRRGGAVTLAAGWPQERAT